MSFASVSTKSVKYVKEKYGFNLFGNTYGDEPVHINNLLTFLILSECCEEDVGVKVIDEIIENGEENEDSFVYQFNSCNDFLDILYDNHYHSSRPAWEKVLEAVRKADLSDKQVIRIMPKSLNYRYSSINHIRIILNDKEWNPPSKPTAPVLEQTAKPQEAVSSLVFLSWD